MLISARGLERRSNWAAVLAACSWLLLKPVVPLRDSITLSTCSQDAVRKRTDCASWDATGSLWFKLT